MISETHCGPAVGSIGGGLLRADVQSISPQWSTRPTRSARVPLVIDDRAQAIYGRRTRSICPVSLVLRAERGDDDKGFISCEQVTGRASGEGLESGH